MISNNAGDVLMKFFSVVAGDEGLSPLHCEDNLDVDLGKCIRQLVAPLVSDSGRINGLGQILVQDVLPCTPFWRMVQQTLHRLDCETWRGVIPTNIAPRWGAKPWRA